MNKDKTLHIIAEAGTNHNGKISLAKKLVDIAVRVRANSIKFQMINTRGLYLPGIYEYGHYDIKEVIRLREKTRFSESQYRELSEYCVLKNIPVTCSVFDLDALNLLMKFNPLYIKIASCDLNNIRLLRQVAQAGKKMVLSTGMSTLKEIERTLKELDKIGFHDIVLMHCVSLYPALLKQTNLKFIEVLKKNFGFEVGFSDHTRGCIAACMALSLGATWFEKHFTLNRKLKGLDHAHALGEKELLQYVSDIHEARASLLLRKDKISDLENYTKKRARRSLYAAKDMQKGECLKNEDVLIVRPENIMQADYIDRIIGKKLKKNVSQYQPFHPRDFKNF
ncbi:MAG: hypothetical protein ACD_79C00090G0004 [uncultured bacterium]|nr:MAG: hypothetical protein ACD_79C00090G0004 [uncultured bacterium]